MSRFGVTFLGVLILLGALFAAFVKVRVVPYDDGAAVARPHRPLISVHTVPASAVKAAGATGQTAAPPVAVPTPVTSPAIGATDDMVPVVAGPKLVMPVEGADITKVPDTWGAPRDGGTRQHHGVDIMAPSGTQVLAAAPGKIEKLYFSKGGGGISIYERSQDGNWVFYYAHLGGYLPGLVEGQQVKAGQPIAYVGDTGNAAPGVHHLHFSMSRMQPGEGWWQGRPVNPYPLLLASAAEDR